MPIARALAIERLCRPGRFLDRQGLRPERRIELVLLGKRLVGTKRPGEVLRGRDVQLLARRAGVSVRSSAARGLRHRADTGGAVLVDDLLHNARINGLRRPVGHDPAVLSLGGSGRKFSALGLLARLLLVGERPIHVRKVGVGGLVTLEKRPLDRRTAAHRRNQAIGLAAG